MNIVIYYNNVGYNLNTVVRIGQVETLNDSDMFLLFQTDLSSSEIEGERIICYLSHWLILI